MIETEKAARPTICAECQHYEVLCNGRSWCDADQVVAEPERFDFIRGRRVPARTLPSDSGRYAKNDGSCRFFVASVPLFRPWWRRLFGGRA